MKFGTLYSYWGNAWQCDYLKTARKVRGLGFDILEMGAPHLLEMPSDPSVRKAGIAFLSDIISAMHLLGSDTLIGAFYTCWPNDFTDLDKPAIWARGVESIQQLSKVAEDNQVRLCLEVLNRFETHILNTASEAIKF